MCLIASIAITWVIAACIVPVRAAVPVIATVYIAATRLVSARHAWWLALKLTWCLRRFCQISSGLGARVTTAIDGRALGLAAFGVLSIPGLLAISPLLRFALPDRLLTYGWIPGDLLIASGLLALLAWLLAVAVLLTHCVLTRLGLTALAVVATLLWWANLRRANGVLPNLGLLRSGRLRLRLGLRCSLAFTALAALHAGFVFLLAVIAAATAILSRGTSCAHGQRYTQGNRPCGLLASGECHEDSLLEYQQCSWHVDSSRLPP